MKGPRIIIWVFLITILAVSLFTLQPTKMDLILTRFSSIDPEPFFTVHMIVPTSGPIQIQERYVPIIKEELHNIGIDSELNYISWARMGRRVTDQEVGQYRKDDGYDICFFEMSLGSPAKHPGSYLQYIFGANSIPPTGSNIMYWTPGTSIVDGKRYMNYRANESNAFIQEINNNWNLTEVKEAFYEWQKVWYDAMPNIVIYNQYEVHTISTGLYGYDPILKHPLSSLESVWTSNDYTGTPEEVMVASLTFQNSFNPLIASVLYQNGPVPVTDRLLGFTPSKELVLPFGVDRSQWMADNFGTIEHLELYPRIAVTIGNFSTDGLQYNISVRDDVLWHDGHLLDAWDVAFSFQARMIPVNYYKGEPRYFRENHFDWLKPFGYDDKDNYHGNYSFIVEDKDNNGFYEHISFQLNQITGTFEADYLVLPLLPEHILGDPVNHGFNENGDFDPVHLWLIPISEWNSHSYNTANPSDTGGYNGPIGCGSMTIKEYDLTEGTVFLEKFENIRWDNSTSAWVNDTNSNHFLVKDGKLTEMPTKATIICRSYDGYNFEWEKSMLAASMRSGIINIMDPQINLFDELHEAISSQLILLPESDCQTMWLNPKFEYDGIRHLDKKGVRHAISHVIPRQKIIDEVIYRGLGRPAYTPLHQNSWAALPEEDLITYKQSMTASDGSTPETGVTTAYDSYNRSLALDWLETEGYDVSFWRNVPTSSSKISTETIRTFEILIIIVLITSGISLAVLFARLRRIK